MSAEPNPSTNPDQPFEWLERFVRMANMCIDVVCDGQILVDSSVLRALTKPPAGPKQLVRRRLCISDEEAGSSPQVQRAAEQLIQLGWEVSYSDAAWTMEEMITVDRAIALPLSSSAGLADVIRDQEDIEVMAAQFRSVWKEKSALILYEDPMLCRNLELTPWFQADARAWDRVIYMLAQHPADLLQIGSREFEQLIAELLHRSGYTGVELTSSSHDGGRDLLVTRDTELGRHLYLVECKRYSPNNPVGARLVRQLHGVAEAECATAALLVTTSRFTKGAVAFQKQVPHRMSLTDYRQLVAWLQRVNAGQPK